MASFVVSLMFFCSTRTSKRISRRGWVLFPFDRRRNPAALQAREARQEPGEESKHHVLHRLPLLDPQTHSKEVRFGLQLMRGHCGKLCLWAGGPSNFTVWTLRPGRKRIAKIHNTKIAGCFYSGLSDCTILFLQILLSHQPQTQLGCCPSQQGDSRPG